MIYLDNAATSFPKPSCVHEAIQHFLTNVGASPGRSTHGLAVEAGKIVFETREKISELFNIKDSSRVIFTSGATESINLILLGFLKPRDKVVTTSLEHNSVMRPLRHLQKHHDIKLHIVPCGPEGQMDMRQFEQILAEGANLAVINHGSNVIGTIAPLEHIGPLVKKYNALLLVDAAQTAGTYPIDVERCQIDFLAFSGHKALLGPHGTGCACIRKDIQVKPLKFGGTGSNSESDEQPGFLPDKYESGTLNGVGIAGLGAGVSYVSKLGVRKIFSHGVELNKIFLDKLTNLHRVKIYGQKKPEETLPTVSINIKGLDSAQVARILNDKFAIQTRVGLHCAPLAHRTIGTFPSGTLRFSFGYHNTLQDVESVVDALTAIMQDM